MKEIRIHIRGKLPDARQLGADALEILSSAAHSLGENIRLHTAKLSPTSSAEEAFFEDEAEPQTVSGDPVPESESEYSEESPVQAAVQEAFTRAEEGVKKLCDSVMDLAQEIRRDVDAICERDPAARSRAEVVLLYSGLHALLAYRASHALYTRGHHFAARAVSQAAKFITGIEIHPGATIGQGLFIDHGSGVVIGETAIVGDNCTIYQGVTLGGTGKDTGKRHPTLGNDVLVGAGAKLLGNFTVGDGAKIAAGAVVLGDVPAASTAVGIPARVVRRSGQRVAEDMDQTHIPDPVSQAFCRIGVKLEELEAKLAALEAAAAPEAPVSDTAFEEETKE